MTNPIKKRLQTEAFKRLVETFLGSENFSWWALFYATLIFIIAGWLPDGVAELIGVSGIYKTLIPLFILFCIGLKLKRLIQYKGKIEVAVESPPHVKILAIFLSPLFRTLKPNQIEQAINNNTISQNTLCGTEWEMIVKAIEYHKDRLERLYVFSSKQTTDLFPLFEQVIKKLYPDLMIIEFKEGGIEFQDIKEVFDSIEELFEKLKGEGFEENDVIVDVTGGQVPNSIAGCIATLSMGRLFQYVSTRDKNVLSYNVIYLEEKE